MRNQLKEMLLWGMNPRKVLYGTDWPLATMESYLQNAASFFKIELPQVTGAGLGSLLRRV